MRIEAGGSFRRSIAKIARWASARSRGFHQLAEVVPKVALEVGGRERVGKPDDLGEGRSEVPRGGEQRIELRREAEGGRWRRLSPLGRSSGMGPPIA